MDHLDNTNNDSIDHDNNNISWESGSISITDIKPKYKNLKEEVLQNTFAKISKRAWNDTLRKCQAIYKGELDSSIKKRWIQQLRDNKIGMKELLAVKLYCDYDHLQLEFRKCFRFPFNLNKDRVSSFYWWYQTLSTAFTKFKALQSTQKYPVLFHGVSSIMNITQYKGQYMGPLSTTTDIAVARSFAGKNGMILVIQPKYDHDNNDMFKPFDTSYLSEFPDEAEILCFNQFYEIKNVILSCSLDENYIIYDQMYPSNLKDTMHINQCGERPGFDQDDIDTVKQQCEYIKCLQLLSATQCQSQSILSIKDKHIIQFLGEFISSYNQKDTISIFESFIDSNLKFIFNDINEVHIDNELLLQFIANSNNRCNVLQIKSDLIQYFSSINVQFI